MIETITEAFAAAHAELRAASRTDEMVLLSADSNRLLRHASAVALQASQGIPDLDEPSTWAFDIAALVKSALRVPGDDCSVERRAHIDKAWKHLAGIANCWDIADMDEQAAPVVPIADVVALIDREIEDARAFGLRFARDTAFRDTAEKRLGVLEALRPKVQALQEKQA